MYYKILNGTKSPVSLVLEKIGLHNNAYEYKIDEINYCNDYNNTDKHNNGFYFTDEKNILNFLGYGDTLYEVTIPKNTKLMEINDTCLEYKSDKIILNNPKKINNEIIIEFLKKGSILHKDKLIGVLNDLYKNKQIDMFETIFNLIDQNDVNFAYKINDLYMRISFEGYIEKYSNTTNLEVMKVIYDYYKFNKIYNNTIHIANKLILLNIAKKQNKETKILLNEIKNIEINLNR
jgi:hypothetical protein